MTPATRERHRAATKAAMIEMLADPELRPAARAIAERQLRRLQQQRPITTTETTK